MDDRHLEVAGDDWEEIYRCNKCKGESQTGAIVFQMFDQEGTIVYEKKYCLKCYFRFWEEQGLGELEVVTVKGDNSPLN